MIPSSICNLLIELSQKYENPEFLKKDPSQFMHRFDSVREAEIVAFIAANLAFGRREQILSHVEAILDVAGKAPSDWILSQKYKNFFADNDNSFYRMYTNRDMRLFFDGLKEILTQSETLGEYFQKKWGEGICNSEIYLHQLVADSFPKNCRLLPHSRDSAVKKVNMLLRWFVRTDSPVDLGLWTWYDKKALLMPLDTHVMQQSNELGLISSKNANLKTAVELTERLKEVFPDDPVRADFALFGLGVDSSASKIKNLLRR